MFTEERISEILAVCEKAPVGPWKYEREEQSANAFGLNLVFETVVDANGVKILRSHDKWLAQFIAISRTALPQLAEDYRKLLAVAEAAEKLLQERPPCPHCDGFAHPKECICEPLDLLHGALADAGYGGEE
jgi:hypothetical protein